MKTKKAPKFEFAVDSELINLGCTEDGDEDIRARYFMTATTPEGRVYRFGWEETPEKAEIVFEFFAPAVSEWPLWRCVYGSRAYVQENCEADQCIREMEEDLGPNWRTLVPERAMVIDSMIQ